MLHFVDGKLADITSNQSSTVMQMGPAAGYEQGDKARKVAAPTP